MESNVQLIVEKAVAQSYETWASQHPSLAAVIDQVKVNARVVEAIRLTPEYQAAVETYIQGRIEIDLLNNVVKLVDQMLPMVLGAL